MTTRPSSPDLNVAISAATAGVAVRCAGRTAASLLYLHSPARSSDRRLSVVAARLPGRRSVGRARALIAALANSFAQPLRAVAARVAERRARRLRDRDRPRRRGRAARARGRGRLDADQPALEHDLARLSRSAAREHGRGAADHRRRRQDRARECGRQRAFGHREAELARQDRRRADHLAATGAAPTAPLAAARRHRAAARRHDGQHLVHRPRSATIAGA